jgi:TolB-like protein
MSDSKLPLIERLKQARIVQVLVVYLGASWAILQIADVLQGTAGLPDWVGAFTLLLLVIGMVVVLATAWVQSLASTTAKEEAGEIPTDWEIAPGAAIESLKSGRLPHLTWGRAILGGVMALSLLFGGAGIYVVVTGGGGLIGPTEAGADEAAAGIAVLPFNVSGEDYQIYREGMVELLSTNLDGLGGYRAIDSRTVLARWEEEVGEVTRPDLATALRAAGRTGARYAILGSLVPAGGQIRLTAEVYDVGDGAEIGTARAEGAPEDILGLVDGLTVGVTRELLGEAGSTVAVERSLASITTSSVEALEYLLEGVRLTRQGDFTGAETQLLRAVALDSTFALGWVRLAEAQGWLSTANVRSNMSRAVAYGLRDRLAPRDAILTEARHLYNEGDPRGEPMLIDFVRRYPDEAQAWYDLADYYFHRDDVVAAPRSEVLGYLLRAVELDPGFTPFYIHLVDLYLAEGDLDAARNTIDAYYAQGGDATSPYALGWEVGLEFLAGDLEDSEALVGRLSELSNTNQAFGTIEGRTNFPSRELIAAWANPATDPTTGGGYYWRLLLLHRAGRFEEASPLLASAPVSVPDWMAIEHFNSWIRDYGVGDPAVLHDLLTEATCGGAAECASVEGYRLIHGIRDGHPEEAEAAARALDDLGDETLHAGDPRIPSLASRTVEGFRAWGLNYGGDPQGALAIWISRLGTGSVDFMGVAVAAEAAGDLDTAERYYATRTWRFEGPAATLRLARLLEGTGRPVEALAQFRRLLTMWEGADEDFQPLLEVHEAVARLGG